jgi:hypothetical protein
MGTIISALELENILALTPPEHNIMLVGRHGIGKSRILTAYFQAQQRRVVPLFLGQMSDPGDIIGLPALDTQSQRTDFHLPWWFPADGQPIVLFLDELNRARPEILQCVMDLTLNKAIVGKPLPPGTQIVAAVNDGEEYQLTDLDPALLSRFNVYHLAPTAAEWLLWAAKSDIDERVVQFISEMPHFLDGEVLDSGFEKTPDRRAWERVSQLVSPLPEIDNLTIKAISGIVGNLAALQFARFTKSKRAFNPLLLLTDFPTAVKQMTKAKAHDLTALSEECFRIIETTESDLRSKYADNFGQYVSWLGTKKHNEVLAHWATLFDSPLYPQTKLALLTQSPQVLASLEKFIMDIKL